MFIAIYHDGHLIKKENINSIFSLPGSYYVFQIGSQIQINEEDGIAFYNANKESQKFRLNQFELIDIEKRANYTSGHFQFSIFNYESDSIKKIESTTNIIEYALASVVKLMIDASKYPTWNIYEEVQKINKYKTEITSLQQQIETLKKQNSELLTKSDN